MTRLREIFRPILRVLRFVWRSSRGWTLAFLALLLLQSLLPLAMLLLLKEIVDAITPGLRGGEPPAFSHILLLTSIYAGLWFITAALQSLTRYVSESQQHLVMDHMSVVLQQKSIELDLAYYENSDYHNTFHKAQYEAAYRPVEVLNSLFGLLQNGMSLASIVGLLFFLHWSVGLVLLIASLPAVFIKIHFARVLYEWERERVDLDRRSWYLNHILTADTYAKEVRLFGFGKSLIERYRNFRQRLLREKTRIFRRRATADIYGKTAEVLAIGGAYAFIAWRTLRGIITLGDLVMYFQAFQKGLSYLSQLFHDLARLYQNRLFLNFLFDFLDLEPEIKDPPQPEPVPDPIREEIVFDQVRFHYPLTDNTVISDLSLSIPKGSVIALVGKNGSGKTTLIKLLCRLYDVDSGSIRIDGLDIRRMPLEQLRRRISVIFQDFSHYQLTATENIQIGAIERPLNADRITGAAQKTGADEFIRRLPNGYDNMLGRQFFEGAELSGGQWQKIALARAFYRDAGIIVLDEPTSAIDPIAEYDIFAQFRELARDKILILVTHRLYNLKMADRIIVMDEGRIVEEGAHEDLMRRKGLYFQMFEKQQV